MKTPTLIIKTIVRKSGIKNGIEIRTSKLPYAHNEKTYLETMVFVDGEGVKRYNSHVEALQAVLDEE